MQKYIKREKKRSFDLQSYKISYKRKRSYELKEIDHTAKNLAHKQLSFKKQFRSYLNAIAHNRSLYSIWSDDEPRDDNSTEQSEKDKTKMSVFIGVMTLMSTAVGTAVFTLPYLIYQSGIIITVSLILFGAILSYYTMIWLLDASFKTRKNNYATIV